MQKTANYEQGILAMVDVLGIVRVLVLITP